LAGVTAAALCVGPQVALVKIVSFKYPKRSEMESMRTQVLAELEAVPEGNAPGQEWAQTIKVRFMCEQ
jgi:hypothetical protein